MKKRLIAYGCSWTEGEGCNTDIEKTLVADELKNFRNENSWPNILSKRLKIKDVINNGICGNSNRKIFNQVISDVENGNVTKEDFICIMFSSSLRDYVPFLPDGEWLSWSVKHLIEIPDKFYDSYIGESEKFNTFLQKYKKFFVTNLFSQDYYNYVNQNYIIFLQKLLNEYKISYVMLESFENMIQQPLNNNFTNLIDKSKFFGELKYSLKDYLLNTKRTDVWENTSGKNLNKRHPNKNGYELISNEIYNFIQKNNLK